MYCAIFIRFTNLLEPRAELIITTRSTTRIRIVNETKNEHNN